MKNEEILAIIESSSHKCAKFVRDKKSGLVLIVAAGEQTHAQMAAAMHWEEYEKGLLIAEDFTQLSRDNKLSD
jgi:hypothetical protein